MDLIRLVVGIGFLLVCLGAGYVAYPVVGGVGSWIVGFLTAFAALGVVARVAKFYGVRL